MGLRLLPWVLGHRSEHKDLSIFDCDRCQRNTTRLQRREKNCGFLPPDERIGHGAYMITVPFEFPTEDIKECPGWLIRLPQVYEAQVAYMWTEKGMLRERYPDGERLELLMDCVQVLSAEQSSVEAWRMTPPDKR